MRHGVSKLPTDGVYGERREGGRRRELISSRGNFLVARGATAEQIRGGDAGTEAARGHCAESLRCGRARNQTSV
jgi:hypothetical protein